MRRLISLLLPLGFVLVSTMTSAAPDVFPVTGKCIECPELIAIPGGAYEMGSNAGDQDERPPHQVNVPSFWLGRTEITQEQWMAVMGGNPSKFLDCDDCPVENVSWNDVQEYLRRLNAKTGKEYRLPTEAEWEYACRAGNPGIYCGGNDIDRIAWTDSEGGSASQPHTVAQKQPNAFGLHDMCGNVWEWVQDCWNAGYAGAPTDGSAWTTGDCSRRGLRGGSWGFEPSDSRATSRFKNKAGLRNFYLGFRVAHTRPAAGRP